MIKSWDLLHRINYFESLTYSKSKKKKKKIKEEEKFRFLIESFYLSLLFFVSFFFRIIQRMTQIQTMKRGEEKKINDYFVMIDDSGGARIFSRGATQKSTRERKRECEKVLIYFSIIIRIQTKILKILINCVISIFFLNKVIDN